MRITLVLLIHLISCQAPELQIEITAQRALDNLPSASGIINHNQRYYIIGDDSPYLYQVNPDFEIINQHKIYTTTDTLNKQLEKAGKPDFEALEIVGDSLLLAFGSGSKSPERDILIMVNLDDSVKVETFSLTTFYKAIKESKPSPNSELNIEAVASIKNKLFLFNRSDNVVITLNYTDFIDFIRNEGPLPALHYQTFNLPTIKGIEAGFSGATALKPNKLLITASVEDTNNAYDDGEILGSFIGILDLGNYNENSTISWVNLDSTTPLKVESVAIIAESKNTIDLVLASDPDNGQSIFTTGILKY